MMKGRDRLGKLSLISPNSVILSYCFYIIVCGGGACQGDATSLENLPPVLSSLPLVFPGNGYIPS